jgi:hypothetical protein
VREKTNRRTIKKNIIGTNLEKRFPEEAIAKPMAHLRMGSISPWLSRTASVFIVLLFAAAVLLLPSFFFEQYKEDGVVSLSGVPNNTEGWFRAGSTTTNLLQGSQEPDAAVKMMAEKTKKVFSGREATSQKRRMEAEGERECDRCLHTTITPKWPGKPYMLACPEGTTPEVCQLLGSRRHLCFEPEEDTEEVLSSFLLDCPGCLYLDIGCNIGYFASQAAALGASVE